METDNTLQGIEGGPHPTLAELRDPSHPDITAHIKNCSMCRSIITSSSEPPIPLDLPKGLVSEAAFRWPADPIARGGMAQIFAGEDRRLGRTVILKAPREGDELTAGMAELFQRRITAEARILAKLQHPAIVTIYELGKATVGGPFCVLQRVEGVSLRDRLDELAELELHGPPRTRERLELLSNLVSIAEALAYAHERHIVHRDCTPNNILLGKRGEATLIARDLDVPGDAPTIHDQHPSMSGRMVTISAGTPPYLPLEQTQGRAADPSFDVYSFGITLYEVVAGKTPFEWRPVHTAAERTEQLEAFLTWLKAGEAPAPAMQRDLELSGIISRAMAHEAGERFTADELVRALKQYLTGDLVFSHRYSATGRLARWARRHKAITVALISLVIFAIGGALVWVQLSRQARIDAELREVASAAKVDASEKGRAADDATHEAEAARARADQAVREGKDAKALEQDADRKRRAAEAMRHDAEGAAARAKGNADDAIRRYAEATKAKDEADAEREAAKGAQVAAETVRDSARNAEAQAEKERDAARAAQNASEREREAAKAAQVAAEKERDAARGGQSAAEKDREAARAAETAAERDRDIARAAQSAVEKERDDARRKLVELEARLRAAERAGNPEPPPAP
jgi:tRNA A-37 threonylcarbamoyl transferase component Bud32